MSDIIGLVGTVLFALSNIPLAYSVYQAGRTDIPWSTVSLVISGGACMLVYGLLIGATPLVIDMLVLCVCWLIILFYKVVPRG